MFNRYYLSIEYFNLLRINLKYVTRYIKSNVIWNLYKIQKNNWKLCTKITYVQQIGLQIVILDLRNVWVLGYLNSTITQWLKFRNVTLIFLFLREKQVHLLRAFVRIWLCVIAGSLGNLSCNYTSCVVVTSCLPSAVCLLRDITRL